MKDGQYNILWWSYSDYDISAGSEFKIHVNGQRIAMTEVDDANIRHPNISVTPLLRRGDYIQFYGVSRAGRQNFEITKV